MRSIVASRLSIAAHPSFGAGAPPALLCGLRMDATGPDATHRVAASGDVEVAAYLEIAQEREGRAAAPEPGERRGGADAIVILDFGSQYSRLIARRIREQRVYCELLSHDATREAIANLNVKGIVLSGGPASVWEPGAPMAPGWVFDLGVPVLGICYGMQLLAHQLGGVVAPGREREYGYAAIHQEEPKSSLFAGLDDEIPVWMSHGDRIDAMPAGFPLPRLQRQLPHRRDDQRRRPVRHPVPPRSRPHAPRQGDAAQLRLGSVRLRRRLDAAQLRRRRRGARPRPGGRWARHLRSFRRRRFRRYRHAGAPRHRRSVDLHLRQQRPAAP